MPTSLTKTEKINAQKFEMAFYSNPDMRQVEHQLQVESTPEPNPEAFMKQLEDAPQLMEAFTQKFVEQYGGAYSGPACKENDKGIKQHGKAQDDTRSRGSAN